MRFMHTADLHLGKVLNDVSMLEDQRYMLDALVRVAEAEQVDGVLIAGDVYQRTMPQGEAVAMFDGFVSRLAAAGRRVFIISGNHDAQQRISYFASLVRDAGVHVTEAFDGAPQKVTLTDGFGPINVYLLPFIKPSAVRRCLPDAAVTGYQDAMEAVLARAEVDVDQRNVLVAHQFISGAQRSDSEDISVGGLDNIDAGVFAAFDYVALGHLHQAQKVTRDTLRYAGSPLKYSLGEAKHHKSVAIVTMGAKGDVAVKLVPITPLRDVRCVDGLYDELMTLQPTADYVWLTLRDELVPPDARENLTAIFPNMLRFSVVNSRTKEDVEIAAQEEMIGKDTAALFCDFYAMQNNGVALGEKHMQVLRRLLAEMEDDHEAD